MQLSTNEKKSNYLLPIIVAAGFIMPLAILLFREYQIWEYVKAPDFMDFFVSKYRNPKFLVIDIFLLLVFVAFWYMVVVYFNKLRSSAVFMEMATAANVPIIILNSDRSVFWTNLNQISFFKGIKADDSVKQLIGTDISKEKISQCLADGKEASYEIETKLSDRNLWLHVSLSKMENRKLSGMICITISDISNLKEASVKIDNQQRELQMQNEMLSLITAQMEVQQAGIKEQNDLLSSQRKQLEEQAKELQNAFSELQLRNKQIVTKTNYITDSIRYAQTIQEAMLPDLEQLQNNFFDNFLIYRPKDIVSGDFYWLSVVDDYVFVVLGDCTGHGVPGAFMSMIGIRMLSEIVNESKIFRPSVILEAMHERIQADLKQDVTENSDGMDIAICRFKFVGGEQNQWELQYAGAKQPIYLKRKNEPEVEVIEANRRGIGGQTFADVFFFDDQDVSLNVGDRVYLTSDGVKDQNNIIRKRFGTNRMKMMISTTSTEKIQDQKMFVDSIIHNWQGLEEQRDDITLWGFELGDHALNPM